MAGGIDITTDSALALAGVIGSITTSVITGASSVSAIANSLGLQLPSTGGPYRDKQQNKPATYSLTVPAMSLQNAQSFQAVGNGTYTMSAGTQASTFYVFDAVLVANHSKSYTPTSKPLQSGYNFSDHIIKNKPRIVLEIGMSDAMAAYQSGMWTGNASKSISAWQELGKLADDRVLMTLATRQETYTNVAIIGIESPETNKTVKGLKVRVTFEQQLLVDVTTQTISTRPNATDSTQLATLQSQPIDPNTSAQHEVVNSNLPVGNSGSVVNAYGVPAGGQFDSNLINVNGVTQ